VCNKRREKEFAMSSIPTSYDITTLSREGEKKGRREGKPTTRLSLWRRKEKRREGPLRGEKGEAQDPLSSLSGSRKEERKESSCLYRVLPPKEGWKGEKNIRKKKGRMTGDFASSLPTGEERKKKDPVLI